MASEQEILIARQLEELSARLEALITENRELLQRVSRAQPDEQLRELRARRSLKEAQARIHRVTAARAAS